MPLRERAKMSDLSLDDRHNAASDATSQAEVDEGDMRALERWLIREAVRRQVKVFLSGEAADSSPEKAFMKRVMKILEGFPPFRDDPRMAGAIQDLFNLSPRLDAALKARRGTISMERFFVSLIASPIVSSARSERRSMLDASFVQTTAATLDGNVTFGIDPSTIENTQLSESVRNAVSITEFAKSSTNLMEDILKDSNGLVMLFEEIKTAHGLSELRPSLQRFFSTMTDSWTTRFMHHVRRKKKALKESFSRLPKATLLAALKLHAGNAAAAAALQVLFARPFGMMSFWQRTVAEAVNLNLLSAELERLIPDVPTQVKRLLVGPVMNDAAQVISADSDYGAVDDPETIRSKRANLIAWLQERHNIVLVDESHKWIVLRYVELVHQTEGLKHLVTVVGTDEFTNSLRTIFSSSKTRLGDSLLAKGSGFVKLVEECFECIQSGITDAERITDDDELRKVFKAKWDVVAFRLFTVLHNLLISDSTSLIHETIQWIVDAYRTAQSIRLPSWTDLQHGLSADSAFKIKLEAQAARQREDANLHRKIGAVKSPPPRLTEAGRLVSRYIDIFQKEMASFNPSATIQAQLQFSSSSTATQFDPIVDIEVSWASQQESDLIKRGYELCGGTAASTIWIRRKSRLPVFSTCQGDSIIAVDIVGKIPQGELSGIHWLYVPRNINKGSFATPAAFIRYRRGVDVKMVTTKQKCVLGVRVIDAMDEFNKRLGADGWTHILTFRSSFFYEVKLWVLYST